MPAAPVPLSAGRRGPRLAGRHVVIGLDVGTTAAKAVAFDFDPPETGAPVGAPAAGLREYPLLEPHPGWHVQDPDVVVARSLEALAECVAECAGADVAAVSLTSALHGLIGLDGDHRPVTPLLTWADARGAPQASALRRSGQAADLHRRTGTPVHPMSPLVKLRWFAEEDPATAARVRWWVGLKDYLLLHLTGSLVSERSSVSASGLLRLGTDEWHPEALAAARVSSAQLPPVLATTHVLPLAAGSAVRVRLPPGTPVVLGAGDGPIGNVGTGALTPGTVGLSLGTSGAVRMLVPAPPQHLAPALFCYALTDDAWALGAAVANGGFVARWAGRALAPDVQAAAPEDGRDAAVLALAQAVPAGAEGLVMVPYLLAERAPLWDPDLPGAVLGLRSHHTRGHLVRAAVEGVCLQLAVLVDQLAATHPVTEVRATGGTLRSPLWRSLLAAALDRPVAVVGGADGTALGAATLALMALGVSPDLQGALSRLQAAQPRHDAPQVTEPDADLVAVYAGMRSRLPRLVEALVESAAAVTGGADPVGSRPGPGDVVPVTAR